MYYDSKNNIIVSELPRNSIGPDGSLYIDFYLANDINLWANHNYYTIRQDTPCPSGDYFEDITKRIVDLDKPYADVTRVWISNAPPSLS